MDSRAPLRDGWIAIAWLEALLAVGLTLIAGAVLSTFCLMCGESPPMSASAKVAFALGIAVVVAAAVPAARASRRPLWLGVGILAMVAGAASFLVGVRVFGNLIPALVLGLVAEGAVAVRAPSRAAVAARALAILVVVLLAVHVGEADVEAAMFPVVALALPALGLADTLAVALAGPRPPDARASRPSPLQSPR